MTIQTILSIAVTEGWPLRQLDINNTFLHGDLQEQVYTTQPIGFINPNFPHHVCRLNNAIYGLKQAPRAWFSKLSNRLLELGFTSSLSNSSLFIYKHASVTIFFLVYMDDIILTGSDTEAIGSVLNSLKLSGPFNSSLDLRSILLQMVFISLKINTSVIS